MSAHRGTPVVVVDASAAQRRAVRLALEAEGEFAVVGEARTPDEGVALVTRLGPAAVVLQLGVGGLAAIETIMASRPTPILAHGADCPGGVAALAAGAVDVLPDVLAGGAGTELCARVRVVARVRVIRHPRGRLRASPPVLPDGGVRLLVLGASTGGPQAVRTVLAGLPADLPQAVLVVQHMGAGFLPGLVAWLDALVPLPVVLGVSGTRLRPGTVTLAPGGANLLVQDDRLRVLTAPALPGQFHVPGIDATFASVAAALGPHAVGVVLTGMGRDGALGLTAMRAGGAATFGQDERTSAVYGMPAAAQAAGGVERQLPLEEIGPALLDVLRGAA